ncbi:hypothetical protein OC846_003396 [Tilletia horrida]|uniref:Ubiquitin-like protease family profile domain-containing protein n=1 Tax=Tilletia horrida TaxID=155126 RepID=A0AAN6GQ43_9BASI|nr:hypothetical protein OC845_003221 [Tilletia horrida]KAK0551156.1 hypothetical protein OC846_003396 [Tilletia horrida]KAK0566111.1 hypothetical protein OC861_003405 [Tilletia horrida]
MPSKKRTRNASTSSSAIATAKTRSSKRARKSKKSKAKQAEQESSNEAELAQEDQELLQEEEEIAQAGPVSRAAGKRKQEDVARADEALASEQIQNEDFVEVEHSSEAFSPIPPTEVQAESQSASVPEQLSQVAGAPSFTPLAVNTKSKSGKGFFSRIGSLLGTNSNNKQKLSKDQDQEAEDTASQPLSKKRKTSHSAARAGPIKNLVNEGARSSSGSSSLFNLFQSSSSSKHAPNGGPSHSQLQDQAGPSSFTASVSPSEPAATRQNASEADSIPRAESAALLALVRNEETPFRRAINAMIPTDPSSILSDLPLVGASAAARLELSKEGGEVETEAQLEVDDAQVGQANGGAVEQVVDASVEQQDAELNGQIEEDVLLEDADGALPNGEELAADDDDQEEKSFADQILEAAAVTPAPSSRRGTTPHILTAASSTSPSASRRNSVFSSAEAEEGDQSVAHTSARNNAAAHLSQQTENEDQDDDEDQDADAHMSFDSLSHPASEIALGIPTKRLRSGNLALATPTSSHLRYSDPSGGADLGSAEASRRRRSRSRSRSVRRSLGVGEGGDDEDEDAKSVVSTSTAAALLEDRLGEAEDDDEEERQPVTETAKEDEAESDLAAEREPSPPVTRAALARMIAEAEAAEESESALEVRRSARIAGEDSEPLISLSDAEEEEKERERARSEAVEIDAAEAVESQESAFIQNGILTASLSQPGEDEPTATQETFSTEDYVGKGEAAEADAPATPVAAEGEEVDDAESEEEAAIISPRKAVESAVSDQRDLELSPSPREGTPALVNEEEVHTFSSQITAVASQESTSAGSSLVPIADTAEPVAVLAAEAEPTVELLGTSQVESEADEAVEVREAIPVMSEVAYDSTAITRDADGVGSFVIDADATRPLADYQPQATEDADEMQEVRSNALTVSSVTEIPSVGRASQASLADVLRADEQSTSASQLDDRMPEPPLLVDEAGLVTTTGTEAEDLFFSDVTEQPNGGPAAESVPVAPESALLLSQESSAELDSLGAESREESQSAQYGPQSQPLRPLDNSTAPSENWRRSGSPAIFARSTPNFIKIGMGASPASLRQTPSEPRDHGFGSSTSQGRSSVVDNTSTGGALFTPLNARPGQVLWSQIPGSSKRRSAQFAPNEAQRALDPPPPPFLTFEQDFTIVGEIRAGKRRVGRSSVGSNAPSSVAGGSRIPRKSGAMTGRRSLWPMGYDEHKYKVERARSLQFERLRANYYEIARREDTKWKRSDFYQLVEKGLLRMKAEEKSAAGRVGGSGIPERTDESRLEQFMADLRVRAEAARQQVPIPSFKREQYESLKTKHHIRLLNRHGILGRPPLPPSLTPDQDQIVDQTFRRKGKILEFPGASISDVDIARLRPGVWLNDESINMYGILIVMRAQQAEQERARLAKEGRTDFKRDAEVRKWNAFWKVHVFNSSFTGKVHREGHKGVARWTSRKKINIFEKDIVLMPINCDNEHWTCGAINFRKKRIEYYDSLRSSTVPDFFNDMRNYLRAEHMAVYKCEMDLSEWEDYQAKSNPQQKNAVDCGMFATQTMEQLSRRHPWIPYPTTRAYPDPTKKEGPRAAGAGQDDDDDDDRAEGDEEYERFEFWNFKQENMPYLRRRMVYELAQSKLLD